MTGAVAEALVLLSGGIDSAVCIDILKKQGLGVSTLFIDYGQAARVEEARSAFAVADYYKVNFQQLSIEHNKRFRDGEIPARNALFVFLGTVYCPFQRGLLCLGTHAGTNYFDCSSKFNTAITNVVEQCTDDCLSLVCPLSEWTKPEIYEYCRKERLPVELTYSCEAGGEIPCGACESCKDKELLRVSR